MEQLQFPELVDIETVARLLGVGERYVRRMVAERRIEFVKVGHYVRFDLSLQLNLHIDHAAFLMAG